MFFTIKSNVNQLCETDDLFFNNNNKKSVQLNADINCVFFPYFQ